MRPFDFFFTRWLAGILVGILAGTISQPALAQKNADSPQKTKRETDRESEIPSPSQSEQMSLQEMLSIALKHNADVRAAEAKLQSVEAELDQTRLQVVRQIIAFREKWQAQQSAIHTAEQELAIAEKQQKLVEKGLIGAKHVETRDMAKWKLEIQRAKLSEIEAELPFLLGKTPEQNETAKPDRRKLISDKLLPRAQQVVKLLMQSYRGGSEADIRDMIDVHRQILDYKLQLAATREAKEKVFQTQKELLQSILKIAEARYRAAQATQVDVLTVDLELSKLDLKRMQMLND